MPPLECSAVPGAAMGWNNSTGDAGRVGTGKAGWDVQPRCEIRQLKALAAAQDPAVWLEPCHCQPGDSDVLQMKRLRCAGQAADSRAVTTGLMLSRTYHWADTLPAACVL